MTTGTKYELIKNSTKNLLIVKVEFEATAMALKFCQNMIIETINGIHEKYPETSGIN